MEHSVLQPPRRLPPDDSCVASCIAASCVVASCRHGGDSERCGDGCANRFLHRVIGGNPEAVRRLHRRRDVVRRGLGDLVGLEARRVRRRVAPRGGGARRVKTTKASRNINLENKRRKRRLKVCVIVTAEEGS